MSIYFTLWSDPAATPLDYSDDVQVASSGTLFENRRQVDKSAAYRENSAAWPGHAFWSLPACTTDTYHNTWWTLATLVSPGTYRLQVTTTNLLNLNEQKGASAENMWALRAVPTDPTYKPYVYGLGKMVIYANVANGTTLFYLGRIEAVHAGKTMVIQLFDPGDASGNSSIEVLKPTATGYVPTKFNYTADANAVGIEERHQRHEPQDDDQRVEPVQQLVGHPDGPAAQDVHGAPPARRAGGRDRRVVEDPLHVRQRDDRHHDLAGLDQGQPRPPRPALSRPRRRRAAARDGRAGESAVPESAVPSTFPKAFRTSSNDPHDHQNVRSDDLDGTSGGWGHRPGAAIIALVAPFAAPGRHGMFAARRRRPGWNTSIATNRDAGSTSSRSGSCWP